MGRDIKPKFIIGWDDLDANEEDENVANLGGSNPYFPASPPIEHVNAIAKVSSEGGHQEQESPIVDPSMSSARSVNSMSTTAASPRPYVSKIGILPSSLPAYHRVYMEREKERVRLEKEGLIAPPQEPISIPTVSEPPAPARTQAEQEETARRLKPHSRSAVRLNEVALPQSLTPLNAPKKPKPTRWQFGIRSKNAPWEALLCIYKALSRLGAGWITDKDYNKVHGAEHEENRHSGNRRSSGRNGGFDPFTYYELPADPWHIKVRWTTDSMRKAQDQRNGRPLKSDEEYKKDMTAIRIGIQVYEMDANAGTYLVDFKCDGYETPEGNLIEDKDVTSPFPFLDMAAKLIMQLAEAD